MQSMLTKYKILVIVFLISALGFSQNSKLIPREVFFNEDERKEIFRINPEGSKVFYIKNLYQPGHELYVFDVKNKSEEEITFTDVVQNYFVFNDDNILINFRTSQEQYFGVYNLRTKETERLESFPISRSKIYNINRNRNEAVAIIVGVNGEKGVYRFNFNNEFTLLRKAEGFLRLYFDEELNIVAGEKPTQDRSKSFHYLKSNEWQTLRAYPFREDMFVRGVNNIISVSSDGSKIYFTDNSTTDLTVLKEFDINSQKEKVILIPEKADFIPNSAIFSKNKKPISMVALFGEPYRFSLDEENVEKHLKGLNKTIKELHILDLTDNGKFWLVENMTGGANQYYLYDTKTRHIEFLFNDFPVFDDYPTNYRNSFIIKSFDGLELPINVYIREDLDKDKNGIPDKPLPTILYVHGGPWIGWGNNNWLMTRNLHLLANRGYAVIYTDFRGATTYGKSFLDKSNYQWGDGMVKDKKAIADWAIKNEIAAPNKVGLFGWSYGGYATMAGLTFASDTYACGIAMYGISDLESFLQLPIADNDTWRSRVADISSKKGKAIAKKHSPINYIDKIKAPMLLSTGGKDQRVPYAQSHKMADAMTKVGKDVTYIYYPDEAHDYRNPNSWTSFWGYAEEFLHNYLGGSYMPFSPENQIKNYEIKNLIQEKGGNILGQWKGPSGVIFKVTENNGQYMAKVLDPGKVNILKKGYEIFNVKFEDNKYIGTYRRYFEQGAATDDPL